MKLIYKKKELLKMSKGDASFLIRECRRRGGVVISYDETSVTIRNKAALEVAKEKFWDL